jgi:ribosomal protein S18 acetylase RimI-like enzyme
MKEDADIRMERVDYRNAVQAGRVVEMLDYYAKTTGGGGKGLRPEVKETLIPSLMEVPGAFSVLAMEGEAKTIGLMNCLTGFSTFNAKALLNIHDIVVLEEYQRQGIGQRLLREAEKEAVCRGCCKLTLEVLEGNAPALRSYRRFGFAGYELDPSMGRAVFMEKKI